MVASCTAGGAASPHFCQSRHPLIIQARMPGSSPAASRPASGSRSSAGMVTVNGIRLNRRRIASSTERSPGLWLPAMISLNVRGVLEEILPHEPRRDRVAAGERLDAALGPASPFLGLDRGHEARTAQPGEIGRVPVAVARGEGLDRRGAVIVAHGAVIAFRNVLLPLAPVPYRKNRACSCVEPVRQ